VVVIVAVADAVENALPIINDEEPPLLPLPVAAAAEAAGVLDPCGNDVDDKAGLDVVVATGGGC
jgi:hypothetical protein